MNEISNGREFLFFNSNFLINRDEVNKILESRHGSFSLLNLNDRKLQRTNERRACVRDCVNLLITSG